MKGCDMTYETDYERRNREARENEVIRQVKRAVEKNPEFLNKMFHGIDRHALALFLKAQSKVFTEHLVVVQAAKAALESMIEAEKKEKEDEVHPEH